MRTGDFYIWLCGEAFQRFPAEGAESPPGRRPAPRNKTEKSVWEWNRRCPRKSRGGERRGKRTKKKKYIKNKRTVATESPLLVSAARRRMPEGGNEEGWFIRQVGRLSEAPGELNFFNELRRQSNAARRGERKEGWRKKDCFDGERPGCTTEGL